MEESKKVLVTGIIIIVAAATLVALYFFIFKGKPEETPFEDQVQIGEQAETPAEEGLIEEEVVEPLDLKLDESDPVVREKIKELTTNSRILRWSKTDDLIRRFVAAVDNIANGDSPRPHMDFFKLDRDFKVMRKEGKACVDPVTYKRYNSVADAFASLDTQALVLLYKQLKPSIQVAYKELGYPGTDFDLILTQAVNELLAVPEWEGDIFLEKKVVTYMMTDPKLETLSSAQKHLLRMGVENVQIIQSKLREISEALGLNVSD